ncbi:MAG TPA: substrate-binding domain-containing protein [Clostridiaceae bacterium]|nr:substrate-binding domain-containing protein [Clostridiaceae bacterium]
MKRFFSIFLIAIMMLTLAVGCNDPSDPVSETRQTNLTETDIQKSSNVPTENQDGGQFITHYQTIFEGSQQAGKQEELSRIKAKARYQFGFSISNRDEFLSALETAATSECMDLGVKMVVVSANNNMDTQLEHIRTFVDQDCDGIIVNLVDTSQAMQVMEVAAEIPVVFVNRIPELSLQEGKSCYVGSDETESGRFQGEFLAEYFKSRERTEINVVMLTGSAGVKNTMIRTEGAKIALENAGINATYVFEDSGQWERDRAEWKMESFLATKTEFDCVICNNDEMAVGAIKAMTNAGLNPQTIPVVGIDATPVALKAMERGQLSFTVFQNPHSQGINCVRAATAFANGETIGTVVHIPFEPVTLSNYKDYM